MNKNSLLSALSLMTLFVLAISVVFTTPVLADSGTTPPAPPSSSGSTRASHSSSNNLSNVPSGTKVVIEDGEGDKLPLGSEQAQQLLDSGDPIWCPSSVTVPISGGSGCTNIYLPSPTTNDLSLLLTYLEGHQPTVAGTIWIESSYNSSVDDPTALGNFFTLNGSTLSTMAANALTIKGGWYGLGSGAIDSTTPPDPPLTTFNVPISITSWTAPVTISDILITGTSGTGLTVTSSQSVTLTRVQVTNTSSGDGASITTTGGTVLITSSQLNGNAGKGLNVTTAGPITLTGVEADDNLGGYGAQLDVVSLGTPYTVTVNGASEFNGNWNDGLDVNANGKFVITDLTASDNGASGSSGYGAVLNNCYVSLPGSGSCAYTSAQPISMTGMNVFNSNYDGGLRVLSGGAITANAVIADSNLHQYGASFDNSNASAAAVISLTGSSSFKYNWLDGLDVISIGAITVNNITANSNGQSGSGNGYGAELNNSTASLTKPGTVKMTGTNYFYDNHGAGLYVNSVGAVTLNSVTANNSQTSYGLQVDNSLNTTKPQSVSLTGTNVFTSNQGDGLHVNSRGVVTLANVSANSSVAGQGAVINNAYAATLAESVAFGGTNNFNGNSLAGLSITSYGAIALTSVTANGNGSGDDSDGVTLTNTNDGATKAVTVKLSGVNTFNDNQNNGLTIVTYGAVTATNLSASGNGRSGAPTGYGVSINNAGPSTPATLALGGVYLSGVSQFIGDYGDGLHITTNGAVSAGGLTANQSQTGYGVYVNNVPNGLTTAQTVKISGTNVFDSNQLDGLEVLSKSAISLSGVTAQTSVAGNGVTLDNTAALFTLPQGVTVSGVNLFTGNANSGLVVKSFGTVSLSSVTATGNLAGYGTLVQGGTQGLNTYYPKGVTISGTNVFSMDYAGGLSITSQGAVALSNINASGNTGASAGGVIIDNSRNLSTGGVTLNGTNTFSSNVLDGLDITSNGAVTLNNLNANNNGVTSGTGVSVTDLGTNTAVKLTGTNSFIGNAVDGLDIQSNGAITANNITAIGNGMSTAAYGASFNNQGSTTGGVTLTGINVFTDNTLDGFKILSHGAISLTKVTADGNGGNGLTATTTGTSAITLTCGSFTDNTGYGLNLTVGTGPVTLKGVVYAGNTPDTNNPGLPPVVGAWIITRSCPLP